MAKKPQTRLQAKAAKSNRIVTGPKGSKPQSTTNAAIQRQGNKITRGGLGTGRPSGTISQTRPKPVGTGGGGVTKSSGMVNANKPTMRQIQAKADALRQRTQNPTPRGQGRAVTMPNSARQGVNLPKTGARVLRQQAAGTTSPAAQARAAAQGAAIRKAAQTSRVAKAVSQRMAGKLAQAGAARLAGTIARRSVYGAVAAEGLTARNTADGTLTAAQKRGDYVPSKFASARAKAFAKAKSIKGSPVVGSKASKASTTNGGGSVAKSFDRAFAAARKSGVKQFTWRGKKYTTKIKGE